MIDLIPVTQDLPDNGIEDLAGRLREQLAGSGIRIVHGARIAIAVGSRGISKLQTVIATLVQEIRSLGGEPFIVPAMGSHGGATATGQAEVLKGYGITEQEIGAPIRSSVDVVELPRGNAPCRVFMDRLAYESDGVIVVNRVKGHTDFNGRHESGLVKMLVIGLGNQSQALEIHRHGVRGLRDFVPEAAREVLATGKVLLGVGIVENAHHRMAELRAVKPAHFHAQDHDLLQLSRTLDPRLPTDDVDILIVDWMGKDISGTGLDTNVIGRLVIDGESEPDRPRIRNIVVCGLTPASHGNAIGVGLADVITRRLFDDIDVAATAENVMTSTFLARGKVPIVAPTPQIAFEWAVRGCGPIEPGALRIVRIRDTLTLERVEVSAPVWTEISGNPGISRAGDPAPAFRPDGELQAFWPRMTKA